MSAMQTTMLLGKTLTALCEGGQCGGEIILTTDGVVTACAAVTPDPGTGYIGADCHAILHMNDGSIVVDCAANADHNTCGGEAVFTSEMLAAEAYSDVRAHALDMQAMDRED